MIFRRLIAAFDILKVLWVLLPLLCSSYGHYSLHSRSNEQCGDMSRYIDPFVASTFDATLLAGTYYELAYHDYTQPRAPLCGCQRSVKTFDSGQIFDMFSIQCAHKDYFAPLEFSPSRTRGLLNGKCNRAPRGICPDAIVDVGTRSEGEPYPWVIEFQCISKHADGSGVVFFSGINFYSRVVSDRILDDMLASSHKHGLGPFLNKTRGIEIVDHKTCTYPNNSASHPSYVKIWELN